MKNPTEPSMEQILASIRKIMSEEKEGHSLISKNLLSSEEVLDLTDRIEEDGSVISMISVQTDSSLTSNTGSSLTSDMGNTQTEEKELESISTETQISSAKKENTETIQSAFSSLVEAETAKSSLLDPASTEKPLSSPSLTPPETLLQDNSLTSNSSFQGPPLILSSASYSGEFNNSAGNLKSTDKKMNESTESPSTSLLSDHVVHAGTVALQGLLKLSQQASEKKSEGKTIEDLTKDLLNPLLREWLNQNLPALVEKIIQQEIQKITTRI